jgi:hypothetical protein
VKTIAEYAPKESIKSRRRLKLKKYLKRKKRSRHAPA